MQIALSATQKAQPPKNISMTLLLISTGATLGMREGKIFYVVLLLLTLFPVALIAESQAAPVNVTLTPTGATLNMHLLLEENITSLPQVNLYLGPSNSTSVARPIAAAIQRIVPGASVTSIELRARTLNSAGKWFLQENYTIQISGSNVGTGSFIRSDVGYLSMNVSDPIIVSGAELNRVGTAYFLATLNAQTPSQTRYFINGHETLNAVIPGITTQGFALLDFSWVPPVSAWEHQNDVLKQTTKWSSIHSSPRYNLTFGRRSTENLLLGAQVAIYDPSLDLTLGHNAWAEGSKVLFGLPSPFEAWMPAIVGAPLGLWAASFVLDRHFSRHVLSKKKKR